MTRLVEETLCQGYGLRIRSAVALPGPIPLPDEDSAAADIQISYGAIPAGLSMRTSGVYRVASADRFEIVLPDVGRFACLDRHRVIAEPDPRADPAHIAEMIVATVLPALLWARGEIVLHAAAFVLRGGSKAIAVAGVSGSGKSTVLASALAQGGYLLADDSICIRSYSGGFGVTGLAGGYFERTGQTRTFRRVGAGQRNGAETMLGAVLVLSPGAKSARRLPTREAIEAMLMHRHRPRIATLLGAEPTILSEMAAIVREVPMIAVPASNSVSDQDVIRRE